MTRPVNPYLLSRIPGEEAFNDVFHHAAEKITRKKTPIHEMVSLRAFSDAMIAEGLPASALDGFFLSYDIPQIGKEFDMLKFGDEGCLNVELKSRPVPLEQIRSQLLRNRHYLGHLGRDMHLYTFLSETLQCFHLKNDNSLESIPISALAKAVRSFDGPFVAEIDGMFRPSEYIVSVEKTPEKYLAHEYFLTQAQEQIYRDLLSALNDTVGLAFFSLTGKPGTGKTLLLYDLGRTLASQAQTAVIHWGDLKDGHRLINDADIGLTILPRRILDGGPDGDPQACGVISAPEILGAATPCAGATGNAGLSDTAPEILDALEPYSYILVDESHRLTPRQFQAICATALKFRQRIVFCLDPEQILRAEERRTDIAGRIEALPPAGSFTLSERMRGNRELQAFIQQVRDLSLVPPVHMDFRDVNLGFASSIEEAREQLAYYRDQGYVFINYFKTAHPDDGTAPSGNPFAAFEGGYDIDHVIGQEFDRVIMLLDNSFHYDEDDRLEGIPRPDPDYLYPNLFYQGITRVQEKLMLLVLENEPLFDRIAAILRK